MSASHRSWRACIKRRTPTVWLRRSIGLSGARNIAARIALTIFCSGTSWTEPLVGWGRQSRAQIVDVCYVVRICRIVVHTRLGLPMKLAMASDSRRLQDAKDVKRAKALRREKIAAWYPSTTIASNREMYLRCALHRHGVASIADFYTPRNLKALALIWHEILAVPNERVRRALAFAFTNTAWHGTRMRRLQRAGGTATVDGNALYPAAVERSKRAGSNAQQD